MQHIPASEITHAKHVFCLLPGVTCRAYAMDAATTALFEAGEWLKDEDAVCKAICSTRMAGRASAPPTRLNRSYSVMAMQNALGISNTVLNVDGERVSSWHRTDACKTHVLANKIGALYRQSAAELAATTPLGDKLKLWALKLEMGEKIKADFAAPYLTSEACDHTLFQTVLAYFFALEITHRGADLLRARFIAEEDLAKLIKEAPALACRLNYITVDGATGAVHDYVLCVDKITRLNDPRRVVPPTAEALKRYPLRDYAPVLHGLLAQWYPVARQMQAPLTTVDTVVPLARAPYVFFDCAKHHCVEHTPLIFMGDRTLDDKIRTLSGTMAQRLKGLQLRYSTKEQRFEATGKATDGGGLSFNSFRNGRMCDQYACYLPTDDDDPLERAAKRHRTSRACVVGTYAKNE